MIRRPLSLLVLAATCACAALGTSAAHAEPPVKIRVSDNVMLLDLSPAFIDTHANFHEIFRSLRRAKPVRARDDKLASDVEVAALEMRSRG
jgi:hypothetical protein